MILRSRPTACDCVVAVARLHCFRRRRAGSGAAVRAFYAGKTIDVLVGFGPGGGYDLYARTLGPLLGRHIAGDPAVVVQNMPGAGSLKVVNYLFNAAPRDGTVIGDLCPRRRLRAAARPSRGRAIRGAEVQLDRQHRQRSERVRLHRPRGIATWQDMPTKKTVIGASGTGADSDVFPTVLRNLFDLPMRIVTGYPGGAELVLAMERGEIDGRCGWSWTSLLARNRDMLAASGSPCRCRSPAAPRGPRRRPIDHGIADRPAPRGGAQADRVAAGDGASVRGAARVPADRVAALRDAFDATMTRPRFSRRDAQPRPRGAAGRRRRGAEPDARNPCLAARRPRARPRAPCRKPRLPGQPAPNPNDREREKERPQGRPAGAPEAAAALAIARSAISRRCRAPRALPRADRHRPGEIRTAAAGLTSSPASWTMSPATKPCCAPSPPTPASRRKNSTARGRCSPATTGNATCRIAVGSGKESE